jgi:3-deoxy-D-manno-octulosonic-acid transferase
LSRLRIVIQLFLYNLIIHVLRLGIGLASAFHAKARLFTEGRKKTFQQLESQVGASTSPIIWIHCSSLGEFEQGRPIIEAFRKEYSTFRILLTFFSPSGYEVRKNYAGADLVHYLPMDTVSNARRWVMVTRPRLAVFVKYEFWHNYALELSKAKVPLLSVSSIFRPDQIFFRSYGMVSRKTLRCFSHFFVQDQASSDLLATIQLTNVTVAGDTRFDRVNALIKSSVGIPVVESFKGSDKVVVAGSVWKEDIDLLIPFINESASKFIIAPHEIEEATLKEIENSIQGRVVRFSSALDSPGLENAKVLLIDNVGMLSRLYRYGEFAYVGGAFGKGLHNILEAACYGIPIFFGNRNYQRFREARELIMRGGAFEVADVNDLRSKFEMITLPENFLLACEVTRSYVQENLGATEKVLRYCRAILQQ